MRIHKKTLFLQTFLLLLFVFSMTAPLNIQLAEGLGYYKGGIRNQGFEEYYSTSSIKYWSGVGYKSTAYHLEDSCSFKTTGSLNSIYYLTQTLDSSYLADITGNYGETITFSFWFKGQREEDPLMGYGYYEEAKAEIVYKYVSGSTTYTRTVSGDWVNPTSTDWFQASVSVNLPSGVNYLQVRIVGYDARLKGSFRTYIDLASLDVTNGPYVASSSTYGKMGYGYAIKSVINDLSSDVDGIAPITASLAVHTNPGYYVKWTKITITLEPVLFHEGTWWNPFDNDYYYTTQKSIVLITSLSQGNNLGTNVDPGELEAQMDTGIRIVGTLFDAFIGAITSGVGTVILTGADILGISGESILKLALDTDYDDRLANAYSNKKDYSAHEKWQYRDAAGFVGPNDDLDSHFVKSSGGIVNYKLMMDTDSATSFTVKMKFEAQIGKPRYTTNIWGWLLDDVYKFSRTLSCTIYI